MRLRAALGLTRAEFNDLSLRELTQFAFAKGEETVMGISNQADATFKAIDAAFAEEAGQIVDQMWNELMARVHYQVELNEADYIAHNDRMAAHLTGRKIKE